MKLNQEGGFPATSTQEAYAKNLKPVPTPPKLSASRQRPLPAAHAKLHQSKLGDPLRLATASRPGICAKLARIGSRIDSVPDNDIYRINDLAWTVKEWQTATILRYASSPRRRSFVRSDVDGNMRARGEKVHILGGVVGRRQ